LSIVTELSTCGRAAPQPKNGPKTVGAGLERRSDDAQGGSVSTAMRAKKQRSRSTFEPPLAGKHDHEDVIMEMMQAFTEPFHGIQFAILDNCYYETQDGLSWGANPTYVHEWIPGGQPHTRDVNTRGTFEAILHG
jgi:hypothetical protein